MIHALVPSFNPKTTHEDTSEPESVLKSKVQKVVNFLLFKSLNLDGVFHKQLAEHIFVRCQPRLHKEFAASLQYVFDRIDLSKVDQKTELYISHIISLIPYCYPSSGDTFLIPSKNDLGVFERCRFSVTDIITLNLDRTLSPFKAYGLKGEKGQNLLVFLGTTFPSADGFLNSLLADFTPFISVGKIAFIFSRHALNSYFHKHHDVSVYGKSLGGALALHALRDYSAHIKEVHAVAPAGLHVWDRYPKDCMKKVLIITQEGDPVSKMGYFPEHKDTHMFEVALTTRKITGIMAHVIAFPGSECAKIRKIDPIKENRAIHRHAMTIFHITMSFFIFSFLLSTLAIHKTRCFISKGK
jgi:hypothetical protein